jgi:hypothetical protein
VWEGQFKGSTQDVKQEVGNMLHYMRLGYKSSITPCCANTFSLSVNSPTYFGLTYWPVSEAEHVRELIDNVKVFVQQLGINLCK